MSYDVAEGVSKVRLDKFLAGVQEDLSRSRLQALIKEGHVVVNGAVCTHASVKLEAGDDVSVFVPAPRAAEPQAQAIDLDIVYEDDHLLVINKAAGMVVHPGAGNHDGTLVNALLHYCGDSLSGIGGVLRPGIVHRLDKDTSGLMMVAKSDVAHKGLSAQLEDRSLSRTYFALVMGVPVPLKGQVDQPIGRHARNRLKMAINPRNGKQAKTFYKVVNRYDEALSLVECHLDSGRTHQIRVHMEAIKHYIIGDRLYGPQPNAVESVLKKIGYEAEDIQAVLAFPRQALHAVKIKFIHPVSGDEMAFEVPLADDFQRLVDILSVS